MHPDLVSVVKTAIRHSEQDFSVHDGLRTAGEQELLVRRGASKTLNSRHLKQKDGFGHAVDLVPYVNGKLRWEWPLIYPIVQAVHSAVNMLDVAVVWGAVWDRDLRVLDPKCLHDEIIRYKVRHKGRDFLDGPHFELAASYRTG